MKKNILSRLVIGGSALSLLTAVAVVSVVSFKGSADLVIEDESASQSPITETPESREQTRKVIGKSQAVKAKQVVTQTTVTTSQSSSDPVLVDASKDDSEMALGMKSELVRRKRMREEMKNEDLLQQRLEELRLRDEEKRTKKVLKATGLEEESSEESSKKESVKSSVQNSLPTAPSKDLEIVEEVVSAPVNEVKVKPSPVYQMSPAPTADQIKITQSVPEYSARPAPVSQPIVERVVEYRGNIDEEEVAPRSKKSSSKSSSGKSIQKVSSSSSDSSAAAISITPRIGFASISNKDFQFNPHYSAGIGLNFDVSENVGVELGYNYSESGIQLQNAYSLSAYGTGEELNYKMNLFDISMKLYFTDTSSKIRPYIGGGVGYSEGYVNYSDRIQQINRLYGLRSEDYTLKSVNGILSAGLDFKVSEKIFIGASYKFVKPVSSSEDQTLNTGVFYPAQYDYTKDYVRASLKESNIHLLQVGATFQF